MTPFKDYIMNNEIAYVALKLMAVIGSIVSLAVIGILSLEAIDKFRGGE